MFLLRRLSAVSSGMVVAIACQVHFAAAATRADTEGKEFVGDGELVDFGRNAPIVRHQIIFGALTNEADQRSLSFSGAPENRYWFALVADGVSLADCWTIHRLKNKELDLEVHLQDTTSGTEVVPRMRLTAWRVSFSPNPKSYEGDPITRRCVLHADGSPQFELSPTHTYLLEIAGKRPNWLVSAPIRYALEGKGESGEL